MQKYNNKIRLCPKIIYSAVKRSKAVLSYKNVTVWIVHIYYTAYYFLLLARYCVLMYYYTVYNS